MRIPNAVLLFLTTCLSLPARGQDPRVAPTPAELTEQTTALLELQTLSGQVESQQQRITQLENELAQASAEKQKIRDALQHQQDSLRASLREMRLTTIISWAHSTSSLQTGLRSAKAVGEVGNITLIYRPNESSWWQNALDYGGQVLAVTGMGLAAASGNDGDQQRSLTVAASGLLLRYGTGALRSLTRNQSAESERLRLLIERTTMHRQFASEVQALNTSIDSILNLLSELGSRADSAIDTGNYAQFRVNPSLVRDYRVLIESYTVLVSQFQHAHSLATQLMKNATWSQEIQTNLAGVQLRTQEAIAAWRRQIIVSQGILENLETLARLDQTCDLGSVNPSCNTSGQSNNSRPGG
jgi:hypothetical protein